MCAGSLTLLIISCEQGLIVRSKEIHVVVNLRPTRSWWEYGEMKGGHDQSWFHHKDIKFIISQTFAHLLSSRQQYLREKPEVIPTVGVVDRGSPLVVDMSEHLKWLQRVQSFCLILMVIIIIIWVNYTLWSLLIKIHFTYSFVDESILLGLYLDPWSGRKKEKKRHPWCWVQSIWQCSASGEKRVATFNPWNSTSFTRSFLHSVEKHFSMFMHTWSQYIL